MGKTCSFQLRFGLFFALFSIFQALQDYINRLRVCLVQRKELKRIGNANEEKCKWGEMEIGWRIGIDPLFGITKEMKRRNDVRQGVGGKLKGGR